ncbi:MULTISPECIES: ABC transporter permease [Brucella]|uniref:ABC transporter permease n=1 Tax=Brucella pseudogrignonensis TaxID=419475 RepID=A0A256G145_9HYPH|nr:MULTISPECIES: ABC transporter permease [Brucella]EMG52011.1 peptide ABC transporter [Ochrobactrum sp. CDB2]MBO1026571.1 ABC transporter permease [Ochrobactrum sp. SD129]KAB2686097.1 ABC transporter permease [Brucella pseudogrignonensis]MCD4513725.1 ABC transporter permease [Brucella pseudogrignonensis]NNV20142.1 ABC transporter permease [Brucella pseudogrignonensis]
MPAFFVTRIVQALIAILGVMTLIFFLQRLAGDPVLLLVPQNATQADIEAMRSALGFDRPLAIQYLEYLRGLLTFDLGRSYVQNVSVWTLIASRLPYTLMLAGGALLVAIGLGIPLGVIMAVRRGRAESKAIMGFVLAGQSMPTFWSAILMIMVFAVWLGWLPPSGARDWPSLIMPSIALGLLSMATFARVARTAVLDELEKDYVRTAHAKGVPITRIVIRHLLRNASIPVVTVAALEIANLLAGAVIVETVFAWPGLGQLTVQAIAARDFMLVQGVVLLGAVTAIALNLVADVLYSIIDPRIRMGGQA